MPICDLKSRIDRLPEQPGVYLYANAAGETIYVGKARSLRDRVRSYLGAYGTSPKTDALLDEADGLEFIVTDSVVEALALENNLIKQRMPKYNILLRDDKNYPYLRLTTTEPFPRVLVARSVERDGAVYAGPFMPASLARRAMSLSHRLFGIRSCNEEINGRRGRPCLEYDIKRCLAPCVGSLCTEDRYARAVEDTRLFLEGRTDELLEELRSRMAAAAADERFEQAAQLRDAARTVQTLRDRQQKMASVELGDRDAFGVKIGPAGAAIQVFQVRHGRVVERVGLFAELGSGPFSEMGSGTVGATDTLQATLPQFYLDREAPPEIHLPVELPEAEATEAWLSARAGRRVRLVVPKRGEKRGLLDLAARNAAIAYESRHNQGQAAHYDGLDTLRVVLGLPGVPLRIECFDISTIQGSETVASMVVCEDGRMKRGDYRKFRIKSGLKTGRYLDDFAAMNQVVMRRYQRVLEAGGPFPDLILIDGGKGQLSAAYAALEELGLANLVAVGLAKKEELVFTRDRDEPLALPRADAALLLLQQIRDEAHRFAVTFHRQARRIRDLTSELDGVPGVGPRRRRALLTAFGSVAGLRRASREELTAIVGPKVADTVLAYFAALGRSG
ncbi:MAG TPA: excinuclease ABC subunit UvrC [Vicinamibacterales bacterium]|jgi:excinuclease ABC subunit C